MPDRVDHLESSLAGRYAIERERSDGDGLRHRAGPAGSRPGTADREFDHALHQLDGLAEIHPESWFPHFGRGIVLGAVGKQDEAVKAFEEAVRCSAGSPYAIGYLACACASAGQRDRAEAELGKLLESAQNRWVPALSRAIAYAGLGELNRVFELLDRACDERDLWLLWHMYDPVFQRLRSDRRMTDLLRRLRLRL